MNIRKTWLLGWAIVVGLGCTAKQKPDDALQAAARTAPVGLEVRAEAMGQDGVVRQLAPGMALQAGNQLAFYVQVRATAHVYLAAASPDGTSGVLYATEKDQPVQPGETRRMPPIGKWFTLDRQQGQEDYFIYAARTPLTSGDQERRLKEDRQDAVRHPLHSPSVRPESKPEDKEGKKGKIKLHPGPRPGPTDAGSQPTKGGKSVVAGPDDLASRLPSVTTGSAPTAATDQDGVQRVRFSFWRR